MAQDPSSGNGPTMSLGTPPDGLMSGVACNDNTYFLLSTCCLLALLLSLCGYRLYIKALGAFAFLVAFYMEGAIGAVWIAQDSREDGPKQVIVVACGILWGVPAAMACIRFSGFMRQLIGFLCGAALGAGVIVLLVFVNKDHVNASERAEAYKGWDHFALATLGIPAALLAGFASMGHTKHSLMGATAASGAVVAIRCATLVLSCHEVGVGMLGQRAALIASLAGLTLLGFFFQWCTAPAERKRDTPRESAAA